MAWPAPGPSQLVPYHNHHFKSTNWDKVTLRDSDIVIATWGKTGTTLSQQLVGQLLSGGDPEYNSQKESPWVDLRLMPDEALQGLNSIPETTRRVLKTHLAVNSMPYNPKTKYVVVMRDGRDVAMSIYNHHLQMNVSMLNDPPGLVGPPLTPPLEDSRMYFIHFMRAFEGQGGGAFWPFFPHVKGWWEVRHLPNVMVVHFSNLTKDVVGEGRRLASFLGIDVPEESWPAIKQHCSIDWMRAHPDLTVPGAGVFFKDGAAGFLYKGSNGRWRDVLRPEDVAEYERRAEEAWGPELAQWMATGQPVDTKTIKA